MCTLLVVCVFVCFGCVCFAGFVPVSNLVFGGFVSAFCVFVCLFGWVRLVFVWVGCTCVCLVFWMFGLWV